MKKKRSLSAVKRVFFTPVDHQKFVELRESTQQQIMRVDLFNIR
ncbi:hypothetical protein [Arthrobacter sp. ERGS1:01]|nr:hypothetical protein [Arthrobacter sp. ERGS1:01]